jgi:hypothetical protein
MNIEMKHTEGNIEVLDLAGYKCLYLQPASYDEGSDILDSDNVGEGQAEANAAHLVKCWNNHDTLVEALKSIRDKEYRTINGQWCASEELDRMKSIAYEALKHY